MMRGRHSWGVAVRRPAGDIARVAYPLPPAGSSNRFLRCPVVRGVVALYESLSLGHQGPGPCRQHQPGRSRRGGGRREGCRRGCDNRGRRDDWTGVEPAGAPTGDAAPAPSTVVEVDEQPPAFGWKQMAVTVAIAMGMAVGLFIVVPLVVAKQFQDTFANPIVFNLVEGAHPDRHLHPVSGGDQHDPGPAQGVRVSRSRAQAHPRLRGLRPTRPGFAQKFSTRHPRCGTGFLLLVFVLAVFLFALVGKPSVPWLVLSRIVGIPIIVGIGYEIGIKWAGRSNRLWARVLLWPGIQLQRLTTREPSVAAARGGGRRSRGSHGHG